MTFKVGERVQVREGNGCDSQKNPLKAGEVLTVRLPADENGLIYFHERSEGWFPHRFKLFNPDIRQAEQLTALEAFKAKAIKMYPDLDDDPDMKEAIAIYNKYIADNDTPAEVYFKEAIKLGRKLEKEGK